MVLISLVVVGCGSSTNTGGDDCGGPDEDGDGIGDACDRCPIAPPPAVADSDNDDVDSPCDPDPTEDGDQIVAFDGFNAGLPAGWTASAGWTFENGEAIATPGDAVVEERLVASLPLVSQHVALLARYEINSVLSGATAPFTGVVAVDERPAGGSEVRCGGSRTGTADRLLLDGDVAVASDPFTSSLFDSNGSYRLALQLDNANAGCAIIAAQETGAAQAATPGEAVNRGGFSVRGSVARFQYLLVVQRGTPPANP